MMQDDSVTCVVNADSIIQQLDPVERFVNFELNKRHSVSGDILAQPHTDLQHSIHSKQESRMGRQRLYNVRFVFK